MEEVWGKYQNETKVYQGGDWRSSTRRCLAA